MHRVEWAPVGIRVVHGLQHGDHIIEERFDVLLHLQSFVKGGSYCVSSIDATITTVRVKRGLSANCCSKVTYNFFIPISPILYLKQRMARKRIKASSCQCLRNEYCTSLRHSGLYNYVVVNDNSRKVAETFFKNCFSPDISV